jgi:aubergine
VLEALRGMAAETWADSSRPGAETESCAYNPALTYVLCMSNVSARFFQPTESGEMVSPQPGTVIESILPATSPAHTFYLINQHVARGTAVPTQYVVAYDSSTSAPECLQNLTYRLSHMYYNFPGAVRLPAPTQYARKLAHLVGTAVQSEIHPRLRETLFYL